MVMMSPSDSSVEVTLMWLTKQPFTLLLSVRSQRA